MVKYIDENIPNLDTSWNNYKGERVEAFIKSQLQSKASCAHFDVASNTLYFFSSEEDKEIFINDPTKTDLILSSVPISFSSQLYRIALINENGATSINVSSNAGSLLLKATFDVQTKAVTDANWTSTGDDVRISISVDQGVTGTYTQVHSREYTALEDFKYDIWSYLSTGINRVKVSFYSVEDATITNSITYTINVAEIYIEELNNQWYQAIIENNIDTYKLGGFKIVGNLPKTLVVEVYSGNTLNSTFERLIGTSTYIDNPYYYTYADGLDFSDLETGVYTAKVYLRSGDIVSTPIAYNFMYINAENVLNARLVCINNVQSTVYNYSTNTLFKYSIYDSGYSVSTPHLLLQYITGATPTTKIDSDYQNVTTNAAHDFVYTTEWLIAETVNLFLYGEVSLGSCLQKFTIPINNSAVYPAETGATFYMNSSMRNNSDVNANSIINEATSPETTLIPIWTNIDFYDNVDGWTIDPFNNRKCLFIPANSKVEIPYNAMLGENMTFEIAYRIANVSNYDENCITVAENPESGGFSGIRIKPTNITVHSFADNTSSQDTKRGTNVLDEIPIHLLVSIAKNYAGNTDRNLVTGYINGCKNFQFSYQTGTIWRNNANIIIGAEESDVYVYFIRVYNKQLGSQAAEKNYINSLQTLEERATTSAVFESILNSSTREISYERMLEDKNEFNFFVVEMLDGATLPSRANGWEKKSTGYSNFEMHYGKHPEWDFKLYNVETSGQGTTSMDYYRWNLRFRIDKSNSSKKIPVSYYDDVVIKQNKKIYVELEAEDSKTVKFDGNNHPALKRITAKINEASSMQGHKIGATKAFNDLHNALELTNEAQEQDSRATVSVYQYPAFGFQKIISSSGFPVYTYIGLFTIGPDKGDKPTFGYDLVPEELITLEGTDHSRRMAKFNYPWDNNVKYLASNECINIVKGTNDYDNGWEVSNCYDLSTDKTNDQTAIEAYIEQEFKPAYNIAFENSTLIFPISLDDETYGGANVEEILSKINMSTTDAQNVVVNNFSTQRYNDRFTNVDMEFWIEGDYTLYHYDIVSNQWVSGINLITQNGSPSGYTLEEQNEWFKTQRRNRFRENAHLYWDVDDSIFHWLFCVMFGATDNFAKNSYPYKMKSLNDSGRWKWRQDDLDTIFDIDNTGGDTKPYWIEFEDSENGSTWFAGSTSVFWNLLYECFWDDYYINGSLKKGILTWGKDLLYTMTQLGGGANVKEGCINFFKKYFWDNAQNYFPASAYNKDAEYKYEAAWLNNGQTVDPLSQSLGNHFLGEQLWLERRIIYLMSLFKVGPFGTYNDASLGQIAFRPQNLASLTVSPSMWMYPALANGAGSPATTTRTELEESKTFVGPFGTDGQTTFYIQASNYLKSVGDLKDLQLAEQFKNNVEVQGAKLKEFKIGDELETVTTNVPSISFPNNKCLEKIDARNAESLTGSIDLSNCTRLKEAYFGGTSLSQINLQPGSKIEVLEYPNTVNQIILKHINNLRSIILPNDLSDLISINVDNSEVNAINMLYNILQGENNLRNIRLIWTSTETIDANTLSKLSEISNNTIIKGGVYGGIDVYGNSIDTPIMEGTLRMSSGIYLNDLENLHLVSEQDFGEYKIAICDSLGRLAIIYDPNCIYINFEDSTVENICVNTWGDGIGLTTTSAQEVTSIGTTFRNNSVITSFNEFYLFGVDQLQAYAFANCSNLESINLSNITKFDTYPQTIFSGCTKLKTVTLSSNLQEIPESMFTNINSLESVILPRNNNLKVINSSAFSGCSNLHWDVYLPQLLTLASSVFYGSGIETVSSLGSIMSIDSNAFYSCNSLTNAVLPETCKTIGSSAFSNCENLEQINTSNVMTIEDSAFSGCNKLSSINLTNATSIGNSVFSSLSNLTFIGFENADLTSVGNFAFLGCGKLSSVLNKPRLASIGRRAFAGTNLSGEVNCPRLASVSAGAFSRTGITAVRSLGTVTNTGARDVNLDYLTGLFGGCESLTHVYHKFVTLGDCCFTGCSNLEYIDLSEVTTIGSYAFEGCVSLTGKISIPKLTSLGQAVFKNTNITSVEDLGQITTLGATANAISQPFASCTQLSKIVLPETLTLIQSYVLSDLPRLQTVVFKSTTPPTVQIYHNSLQSATIYVPYSADHSVLNAYKATTNLIAFAENMLELNPDGTIPE